MGRVEVDERAGNGKRVGRGQSRMGCWGKAGCGLAIGTSDPELYSDHTRALAQTDN